MITTLFIMYAFIFFTLSMIFISLAVYCIPIIVAFVRKHNNIVAISILTIFLGWSFLGWLGALLWALNSDVSEEQE